EWILGAIVGAYHRAVTISLLAAIVNHATSSIDDSTFYRISIAAQFELYPILFLDIIILPQTPQYLVGPGRIEDGSKALGRIRRLPASHASIKPGIDKIPTNHEYKSILGQ
ncbi:hypothetical protein EDB81DRAFT_605974, partial [Dactylonectria macrodidyma]